MELVKIEQFVKELEDASSKIKIKDKTIFEISGIFNNENIISNILAFYFNPREQHEFNDLLVRSLLKVVKTKNRKLYNNIDTSYFDVYREYTTLKGNRIDIVLQNKEVVIGIENKIYASLSNDLMDYSKTLDKKNINSIKILLTLNKINEKNIKGSFINVTYKEFIAEIKINLKKYKKNNTKWYTYLIDFIDSIEGIEVNKKMENEINNWINCHKEEIKDFNELLKIAQNNINKKIQNYELKFNEKNRAKIKFKHYFCGDEVANTSYIVFDSGYNLDVKLNTEEWKIGINVWKNEIMNNIKDYLAKNGIKYYSEGNHLWFYNLSNHTPIDEIVEKVIETYKKVNMLKYIV